MARGDGVRVVSEERQTYRTGLAVAEATKKDKRERASETARKKRIHEEAMERFKLAAEADARQRERELEDLQFARALPEDHWPDDIRRARAGGIASDGKVLPERPCLVINRLAMPIQLVVAEAREAHFGIVIKAKGDSADPQGAELRQGMIRAIEQDSNASQARLWALERALHCGRGYYRVLTDYCNDGDFDLDIKIERILNQGCVYLDPFAQAPDWRDGEFAFITDDLSRDEFKRRFGTDALDAASADDMTSATDQMAGWVTDDVVRVAEYYYVEHRPRVLVSLPDGRTLWQDEVPDGVGIPPEARRREVDDRSVKWCILSAAEILDEQDWPGRFIPIIPVMGREFVVENERVWKGMVSDSKDAQRSYNYMRSAQVEQIGLSTRAPWVIWEGQDEGYEAMWDSANTRNYTRLVVRPVSFEGTLLPPPQRNVAEPPIQAISVAVREAEGDLKATTGRFDPSLGQLSGERSGKAIQALQSQGQMGSSVYLSNLAQVSMVYEAQILLDLLPKVYDRPGRIVRLLGDDPREEQPVILGVPFQVQNGQPVPVPPGPPAPPPGLMGRMRALLPGGPGQPPPGPPQQPPPPQGMPPPPPQAPPKVYRLDPKGDYAVRITVGQSKATQREANASLVEALIQAAPDAAPMVMDLWAEQLDGPMAAKLSERLKSLNPQLHQPDALPPAVQAQMQQLQQQLQEAQQIIATEQHKAQAQGQIKQMELQAQAQLAQQKAEVEAALERERIAAQAEIARIEAEAKAKLLQVEAAIAREAREDQQAHERAMQAAKLEAELASKERIAAMQIEADRLKTQQQAQVQMTQATQKVGVDREKVAVTREAGERQAGLARETLADQQRARAEAREEAREAREAETDDTE